LVALVLGVLHQFLAPDSGTDLAAQLARASFARAAPLTPVDLSWYSGIHPYGYSLLAPWVMALLGVAVSGLLAAVAAAVLFARLLRESERPWLASVVGAVFAVANVASGRTTFALGAVAALAALVLLPRLRWVAVCAVLTALLSPVAAAFLGFIAAVLVLHRRPGGWTLGLASTVPVALLGVLFPGSGIQPFSWDSALPAVMVALVLAFLTTVPEVRTGAVLYAGAVVVFANHDDPFGSNVLRLGLLVSASLLLATSRGSSLVVLAVTVGFLWWQVDPTAADLEAGPGPRLAALTEELVHLQSRRAEVVAPRDHRESWQVAEHVPLARGWSRQIDLKDNPLFYKGTLTQRAYHDWLLEHSVDSVAVPRTAVLDFGSTREGELLRQGPAQGLVQVWSDRDWTVFRVADARPLAAPPATVVSAGRTTLVLRSDVTAEVRVDVRWSRWLSVKGSGCVQRDGNRTLVRFTHPGTVTLGSGLLPYGHC
jgi:hypothetical protein